MVHKTHSKPAFGCNCPHFCCISWICKFRECSVQFFRGPWFAWAERLAEQVKIFKIQYVPLTAQKRSWCWWCNHQGEACMFYTRCVLTRFYSLRNYVIPFLTFVMFFFHTKGQIISECPYEIIVSPKIPTKKICEISALASKERSNQKLY